ncbi:MAG: hypothetical protein JWQ18_3293, partial [Conexibacter sp.]|nr:hypothetical protein [Conexibacter sp.]
MRPVLLRQAAPVPLGQRLRGGGRR